MLISLVDATGVTTTAGTVATTSAPSSSETPCPTNPCLNGAACYLLAGAGFVCTCAAGYTGPYAMYKVIEQTK